MEGKYSNQINSTFYQKLAISTEIVKFLKIYTIGSYCSQ